MKKGFTMIEILAVFTLTAIIILIIVPFVINTLKGGSDMKYTEFIDSITLATEAYIGNNDIEVTDDTKISITELIENKYLKSTIVNPYNNAKLNDSKNKDLKVKVTRDEEDRLIYEIEGLNE